MLGISLRIQAPPVESCIETNGKKVRVRVNKQKPVSVLQRKTTEWKRGVTKRPSPWQPFGTIAHDNAPQRPLAIAVRTTHHLCAVVPEDNARREIQERNRLLDRNLHR